MAPARKRGKARREEPFTVAVPRPLPAERDGEAWWMEAAGRRLRLSNLDKVFWPEEGYTKGDLVAYYFNVAELILPYLAGRPLTMKRMPNGITGDYFYEKNAPSHTPEWMPRCRVESEGDEARLGYNDFLMAEDLAGLLFVVNLGAIEFHPLHSRCGTIDQPDYAFFDLDPFEPASFEDVRAVARHVRAALDALGLASYPKISGATGMQIYVPVTPGHTYEETRGFVGAIGRAILRADPDRVTMEWDVSKRTGKVFVDHNMNRLGANIASAYSVRPEAGATVSTPLTWEEVEAGAIPQDFTIATVHERFAEVRDLFRGVVDEPVDLHPVFDAIGLRVEDKHETAGSQRVGSSELPRAPAPSPRPALGSPSAPTTSDAPPEAATQLLDEYRRKRDFAGTPEPAPKTEEAAGPGSRFVIQKHNATRLHYDLRLERDGVLVSWAVPRGLPTVPGERRLAVRTEDHPMDYADFEGWIPEGHYGAGEVKIFDRGTYEALEWKYDKLTFRLNGRRHLGEFHLVKTRTDWLVFLSKRSANEQPAPAPRFTPMLAELWAEPFDDPRWRFEPKLDGIRTLAYVSTDGTRLISRTGRDQSAQYPELDNLAENVNALQAVIDAEIVAPDPDGRPSFELLQQRMNLASPRDIERARRKLPVVVYAFDLLWLDGRDLTGEALEDRRALLESIVTADETMRLTTFGDGEGTKFFEAARRLGFEGVVGKKLGSIYQPGRRSRDWRKIKVLKRQSCVVLGWTPGTGSRAVTFGSLLVGAYKGKNLVWIGQVGTGFTDPMLADLMERLLALEAPEPPVDDPALRQLKGARWVRPELVCEVEYLAMTSAGKLRAPSYKGLRPDKVPQDCLLERPAG
ncbi:MAG TPA: non-homologous end-joining DNA ligase [Actinomycetota bacterium]|jgi:DNA ligase D-like protein (predicted ligase)/DNA ligase D-like protein (predicted polymerase)/DNA ligase D-like protein (predicted 3'-phosphoesterase)|nr:non-homologous end-joining DNA ligase [Actinomycetota bacterium]